MKCLALLLACILYANAYSQKKELNLDTYYGYAIGTTNNYKKVMLSDALSANLEFKIRYDIHYSIGIGMNRLHYNLDDNSVNPRFNSITFINLPVNLKKYYTVNKNSTSFAYVNAGLVVNYLIRSKTEIRINGQSYKSGKSNVGFNIGVNGGFGFKTVATKNVLLDVGLYGISDVLSVYKNDSDKIKANITMLKIGFTLLL